MTSYTYNKTPVNLDSLTIEVQQSQILTPLDYMYYEDPELDIYFASELTNNEKILLDNIIANHQGLPPLS